jgi:hypothetical protein
MVAGEELLPQAVLRQIGDKLYEKRKLAALEVEQVGSFGQCAEGGCLHDVAT